MKRNLLAFVLALGAPACAGIVGVDGDYHEIDFDAGASATGGSGASSNGGSPSGGGSGDTGGTDAGGGLAGMGAIGGVSGSGPVGGGGGGTTDGGGTPCADLQKVCAGAVPATFAGPVVLYESSGTPSACPAEFPQEISDELHSGFTAGTASCKCNCSTPTITCGNPSVKEHGDANCSVGASLGSLTPGVCKTFTVGLGNRLSVTKPTPSLGSCAATKSHNLPAVTWGVDGRSCGGASVEGACSGGEVCVPPQPSGSKLCVHKDGDVSCPAGYYSEKHLLYADSSDTRSCSLCSCASATGGECKGSVSLTAGGSTCDTLSMTLSLGACSASPVSNVDGGKYTPGTHIPGSCAPVGGVLSGSASPTNPTTYCCAP